MIEFFLDGSHRIFGVSVALSIERKRHFSLHSLLSGYYYLIESQIIMIEVQSGSSSSWDVAFSRSLSKLEVDRPNMVDSVIVEIRYCIMNYGS